MELLATAISLQQWKANFYLKEFKHEEYLSWKKEINQNRLELW